MAHKSFFPSTDSGLLYWSANFSELISADPLAWGLTALQASQYASLHAIFASSMLAVTPGIRSQVAVATKNQARQNLKAAARPLVSIIQGQAAITSAQKVSLGLTVRSDPTRIAAPDTEPGLEILSARGNTVQLKLYDRGAGRRGKPTNVIGAAIFTFAGDAPPSRQADWQFHSHASTTKKTITFPSDLSPGTKVWFTAFWLNRRLERGPASAPLQTHLQGGGVSLTVLGSGRMAA